MEGEWQGLCVFMVCIEVWQSSSFKVQFVVVLGSVDGVTEFGSW